MVILLFRVILVHELRLVHHHGVFPVNLMKPATNFGGKKQGGPAQRPENRGSSQLPPSHALTSFAKKIVALLTNLASLERHLFINPKTDGARKAALSSSRVGLRSFQGVSRSARANSAWFSWKPTRICCWALRGILGATTRIAFVVAVVSSAPPLKSKVTGYTCLSKIWFP